jgi:SAM-dependent methyltransferase
MRKVSTWGRMKGSGPGYRLSSHMNDFTAESGVAIRLSELIEGYWSTQVIRTAAQLKLPDLLNAECMLPEELARRAGAHAGSVARLLRAMVTLGLCQTAPDGRYSLTGMGALLRADAAGGKRARALFAGSSLYREFARLPDLIRTGPQPPSSEGFEKSTPEQLAVFQQAMIESSREAVSAAVVVYDFSHFTRVLDVGGGFGGALACLLERFSRQSGDVLDLAHAQAGAEEFLSRAGVADRARFLAGDFFKSVPTGYDCYLLKFILHDWDDAQAVAVLKSCRAAAEPGSHLIVLERLVPDHLEDQPAHRAVVRGDMTMMAWGGQERTAREYRQLFAQAGFQLSRVVPTASPFGVIEGRPI